MTAGISIFAVDILRFRLAFAAATQSPRSETAVVASVLLRFGQVTENIVYF